MSRKGVWEPLRCLWQWGGHFGILGRTEGGRDVARLELLGLVWYVQIVFR